MCVCVCVCGDCVWYVSMCGRWVWWRSVWKMCGVRVICACMHDYIGVIVQGCVCVLYLCMHIHMYMCTFHVASPKYIFMIIVLDMSTISPPQSTPSPQAHLSPSHISPCTTVSQNEEYLVPMRSLFTSRRKPLNISTSEC